MTEERFIEIETKITHQEFLIEQLNKVIYEQQGKINQLETILTALVKRTQEIMNPEPEIGPANDKPPHY
ncbi:MAG TPA: SlyX family protein [Pseudobdellovibrionaceae bacterium]|jgi:SlyX protein